MKENLVTPAGDMTEEQARVEIERIQVQIQQLFDQMKRDREEGQRIVARTDATRKRVREGLDKLLAR